VNLIFLGTGGATITPRPGCKCRVCSLARLRGVPYSRLGPALFVQELNGLFDTPEEIAVELERNEIGTVDNAFYTHWHPDHTSGMRVFEQLNLDISFKNRTWAKKTTTVHLPPKVEDDFRSYLGLMERLSHLEEMNLIALRRIGERQVIEINGVLLQCWQMANPSLYAYLMEEKGRKVLLALDDTFRWVPPEDVRNVDLAVLEAGWFERAPDGTLLIGADNPIRRTEAPFEETLEKARLIGAGRTVLTHIEEIFQRTYDDLKELEKQYAHLRLSFAYDGLTIQI